MNLLMNTQASFEEGVAMWEEEGDVVGWGGGVEVRHHVNLFGIHTVCAYIVLFHHFMARLTLLGCGPPEKTRAHIATP